MRLGETTDPKELIPGEAGLVERNAEGFGELARKFEHVGEELKRVDFGSWSGTASDSFQDRFSREPVKWLKCADGAEKAAKALSEYAGVLRWAQTQAAEAIEIWERGEASRDSKNNANESDRSRGHSAENKFREEARSVLKRAEDQLDDAGRRVAKKIGEQDGDAALALMLDTVSQGGNSSGKTETKGPDATASASVGENGKLAQAQAQAQLASVKGEGSTVNQWGTARGAYEASVDAAATTSASVGNGSLQGSAEASAGARAQAEGRVASGPAEAHGKVDGFAGVRAGGDTQLSATGVNTKADAFAGAKASAEGGADIGGIGVTGSAEGWAGAGAETGFDIGMNDEGNFVVETNVGAAIGVGGSVGGGVEIDPEKVGQTASDAVDAVGDAWNGATSSAQQTMSGWL